MNSRKLNLALAAVSASIFVGGCSNIEQRGSTYVDNSRDRMENVMRGKYATDIKGVELPSSSQVRTHDKAYLGVSASSQTQDRSWISGKKITVSVARNGMTVEQLISHLGAQGVNVSTRVPIAGMQYKGLGVKDMDGESAVKILFGSIGLDVDLDGTNKTVVLKPLTTHTWFVGIADRKSSFRAGGRGGQQGGGQQGGQTGTVGNNSNSGQAQAGMLAMIMQDSGTGSIEVNSDFWKSLKDDITARLTVMLPRVNQPAATPPQILALPPAGAPGADGSVPMPSITGVPTSVAAAPAAAGDNANSSLEEIKMGTVSVNSGTGAVAVQAPSWLVEDVEKYMKKVIDSANTTITFSGEILAVESSSQTSEGLDVSGFAAFAAKKYGAFIQNNPLGGVTVSFPQPGSNIPGISSAVSLPGSGSLVGVQSAIDGVSVFNSYLSQFGTTKVVQRPVVSTTSSVPGEFSRTTTRYYNNLQQSASAGSVGSAATATQNNLIPVQLGTMLRIVPLFNPVSRTVRAQMSLQQSVQTGVQNEAQIITVGNTAQSVNTAIPIISRLNYSGETVLRDGDLVVVGGMIEDAEDATNSGIRGTEGSVLAPVTRQGKESRLQHTYYVALRVSIEKKD